MTDFVGEYRGTKKAAFVAAFLLLRFHRLECACAGSSRDMNTTAPSSRDVTES